MLWSCDRLNGSVGHVSSPRLKCILSDSVLLFISYVLTVVEKCTSSAPHVDSIDSNKLTAKQISIDYCTSTVKLGHAKKSDNDENENML